MRELKFRAWDKDKKVMHYDFQFIKSGEGIGQFILLISDKEDNVVKQQNPYPVDRFEIMQYTELKDNDGKEIYESDILKYKHTGEIVIVDWDNEIGCYIFDNENEIERDVYIGDMSLSNEYKIIGNKYENPELMEE